MVYGDFKDLNRRTAADRILHDKAFNIPKNQKHDGCKFDKRFRFSLCVINIYS